MMLIHALSSNKQSPTALPPFGNMEITKKRLHLQLEALGIALLFLLAFCVRSVGIMHGLEGRWSFHPDALKQVVATHNFLSGTLLWYTGSLGYDGYPYGLNHIDASLIRMGWPMFTTLTEGLIPTLHWPEIPTPSQVFVICRILRVVYGMLAFSLYAFLLHRRKLPLWPKLAWLSVGALSPLSSVVTHSATGDVGTDLFVMGALTLFFLGLPKPTMAHYAGCGLLLGCGFATKYHAVLAGLTPAIFWMLTRDPWKKKAASAFAILFGFFGGILLLTPQFWIRPEKTISLIRDNIQYIRHFNVDPEFYSLPVTQQILKCYRQNLPELFQAIGPWVCLAVLLAAGIGGFRFWQQRKAPGPGLVWDFALLWMVLLMVIFSLATKPEIQAFHFSFILYPLFLGTAGIWNRNLFKGSATLLALLFLLQLGNDVKRQRQETRLWSRVATQQIQNTLAQQLLHPDTEGRATKLAALAVEGPNLSVFRNPKVNLVLPQAEAWKENPHADLPQTPYSFNPDWIFLDLPRFPRDDRLIHLKPHQVWNRFVIHSQEQEEIPVLLRTGEISSNLSLDWNGRNYRYSLPPHAQKRILLSGGTGTLFTRDGRTCRRSRMKLSSEGAEMLVQILASEQGEDTPEVTAQKLKRSQFLSGIASAPKRHLLVGLKDSVHLPPALYQITLRNPDLQNLPVLQINNAQLPHPDFRKQFPFRVSSKQEAFATFPLTDPPLFSNLVLSFNKPPSGSIHWELRPIAPLSSDPIPDQDRPQSPPAVWSQFRKGDIRFSNLRVQTSSGQMETEPGEIQLSAGETLTLAFNADTRPDDFRLRNKLVTFVHILTLDHRQVLAKDIRLNEIPPSKNPYSLSWDLELDRLPPGQYHVLFGLYDPATHKRFPAKSFLHPSASSSILPEGHRVTLKDNKRVHLFNLQILPN